MKDSNTENNLIKYEEGFFHRIKNFFKRLFKKEEVIVVNSDNELQEKVLNVESKTNVFKDELKYKDESKALLDLQNQFELGKIKEEDLTEEQVQGLRSLYNQQIENLKNSIENYRKEILTLKKKLNSF